MKRALAPATNPAGIGSSAAAIYAAVVMIVNAAHHHAVIDPQVVIAAIAAAAFLYARFKVTPVADPKDGNGQPLVAAVPPAPPAPPAVITVNTTASAADIGKQVAAAIRASGMQQKTLRPPAAARGTDISPLADPPMEDLPGPLLPPAGPE